MNLVAVKPVPSSTGTIGAGQRFNAGEEHARNLIASGHARHDDGTEPPWDGIQWSGAAVVILASGPSLTDQQCADVYEWRHEMNTSPRRVIAINTTFRKAPWADVLYACDAPWWRAADDESKRQGFRNYCEEAHAVFKGELWTQDDAARREFGIRHIESRRNDGLGRQPGVIHQGSNSGYQAVNLAYQAGAKRLILLGFDMKGTHWHGRYTNGLSNTPDHLFARWIENFRGLAADLANCGVEVVNASPRSALDCFERVDLEVALK